MYSMAGLVETLTLENVFKQQPTYAAITAQQALQENSSTNPSSTSPSSTNPTLLVNSNCGAMALLRHIADRYVELLYGGCSNSSKQALLAIMHILRHVAAGNIDIAEEDLQHQGVPQVPLKFQPWAAPSDCSSSSSTGAGASISVNLEQLSCKVCINSVHENAADRSCLDGAAVAPVAQ